MNKCFLYILILFYLSGCAAQKLSVADKQALKTIRINPIVKISHPLYYYTGQSNLDIATDAAVDAALDGLYPNGKTTYQSTQDYYSAWDSNEPINVEETNKLNVFLDKNNILIDEIVLDELNSALRKNGKVSVIETDDQTKATMSIGIYNHGFYVLKDVFYGTRVVPLLSIVCAVKDSKGKTIWGASHEVEVAGNPVKAAPLDEFIANAKTIDNLWRSAAKVIIDNILVELYSVQEQKE